MVVLVMVTVYYVLSTGCYRNVFDLGNKNDCLQKAGRSTGVLVERGGRRMGWEGRRKTEPDGVEALGFGSFSVRPFDFLCEFLALSHLLSGFSFKGQRSRPTVCHSDPLQLPPTSSGAEICVVCQGPHPKTGCAQHRRAAGSKPAAAVCGVPGGCRGCGGGGGPAFSAAACSPHLALAALRKETRCPLAPRSPFSV